MVGNVENTKNIFSQVEHIQIVDMRQQSHEYFGLIGIGNFGNIFLQNRLLVSDLQNLTGSAQEEKKITVGCAQI